MTSVISVASLGDSFAILGVEDQERGRWEPILMGSHHNGQNSHERKRIHQEHPNEPDLIVRNRVLGASSVTRAIGDYHYKLGSIYIDRVFMNVDPGWMRSEKRLIHSFIDKVKSPPYIFNEPDVRHIDLMLRRWPKHGSPRSKPSRICLLLCTDGLEDLDEDFLNEDTSEKDTFRRWLEVAARSGCEGNGALALLRQALGGTDEKRVSAMLTAEVYDKWMDDTTILFEFL